MPISLRYLKPVSIHTLRRVDRTIVLTFATGESITFNNTGALREYRDDPKRPWEVRELIREILRNDPSLRRPSRWNGRNFRMRLEEA